MLKYKMKKVYAFMAITLLLALLVSILACTPEAAAPSEQRDTSLIQKPGVQIKNPEQAWQELMKNSRREGKLVILNSGTFVGARQALMQVFSKKYGIDVEFTAGESTEINLKLFRERAAGLYLVDIQIAGASTFLKHLSEGIVEPLEPYMVLPEIMEPRSWVGGKLPFIDNERKIFAFGAGVAPYFLYNTDQVKPEELKSFKQLLNPKWKGKLAMHTPIGPGAGQKGVSVIGDVILGWDSMRELAKLEPFITKDHYQLTDWVVKGKRDIALFIQITRGTDLERAGAPVKMVTIPDITYLSGSGSHLGFINRAPHPNAAKLFINWLLSKEGQAAVYKEMGLSSARIDVPVEGISPVVIPEPSRAYFNSDTIEWSYKQPERDRMIAEIFGPLMK